MTGLRPHRLWFWLLVPVLLQGCAGDSPDARWSAGSDAFRPVTDVQGLMVHVVEPAAEVYWDAVGWIIDYTGTLEIEPQSEEEWEEVVHAAYMVAESGNLLMMEGRVQDGPWTAMSQAMIEAGRGAIRAAEARDKLAVFDMGAEIYYSCTGCHAVYAAETLRPSAAPIE